MKKLSWLPASSALLLLAVLGLGSVTTAAWGQEVERAQLDLHLRALPESPGAISIESPQNSQSSSQNPAAKPAEQTTAPNNAPPKRLFGIIPNFRSVSTNVTLPPQTVKDKLVDVTKDSFDYSSLALQVLLAAYSYGTNATPEFGKGGVGYGRYLWHASVDQTQENYWVEFIIPVIAHEDTRFYILDHGSFWRKTGYSLGQVFVTKSDSDKRTFNSGEIFGAAIASGISEYYYPSRERSFGNFAGKYVTNVGIDAASYFVKEFYPDISNAFSRHKQTTPAP